MDIVSLNLKIEIVALRAFRQSYGPRFALLKLT